MRNLRWVGLCAAVAATPALAQEVNYTPLEAERTMDAFSRCIVDSSSRRASAERFVRMIPETRGFRDAGLRLASGQCVPRDMRGTTRLRFQPDYFRSSLFASMYRREFGSTVSPTLAALPPLSLAAEFDGDVSTAPESLRFTRNFGDCVARADAVNVHAFVLADTGTDGERQAIAALRPALANCLPAGRELRFSRGMLRGMLAEGIYKLRKAAAAGPGTSSGAAAQEGAGR